MDHHFPGDKAICVRHAAAKRTKITKQVAEQIRAEYAAGGSTMRAIGAKYGMKPGGIREVLRERTWVRDQSASGSSPTRINRARRRKTESMAARACEAGDGAVDAVCAPASRRRTDAPSERRSSHPGWGTVVLALLTSMDPEVRREILKAIILIRRRHSADRRAEIANSGNPSG